MASFISARRHLFLKMVKEFDPSKHSKSPIFGKVQYQRKKRGRKSNLTTKKKTTTTVGNRKLAEQHNARVRAAQASLESLSLESTQQKAVKKTPPKKKTPEKVSPISVIKPKAPQVQKEVAAAAKPAAVEESWFKRMMNDENAIRCPPKGKDKWSGRQGYECPVDGCDVRKRDTYEIGRHMRVKHPELLTEEEKKRYRARDCSPRTCDVCGITRTYRRLKDHKCEPEKKDKAPEGSAMKD